MSISLQPSSATFEDWKSERVKKSNNSSGSDGVKSLDWANSLAAGCKQHRNYWPLNYTALYTAQCKVQCSTVHWTTLHYTLNGVKYSALYSLVQSPLYCAVIDNMQCTAVYRSMHIVLHYPVQCSVQCTSLYTVKCCVPSMIQPNVSVPELVANTESEPFFQELFWERLSYDIAFQQ